MGQQQVNVLLGYQAITVEIVPTPSLTEGHLHVEYQLELGLERAIVDLEHGFDELLLAYVFIRLTSLIDRYYLEEALA